MCPPFVYFGAHPGDGADFGFWPDMEPLEDEIKDSGEYVNDEWLLRDAGLIVDINDHGNMTVMDMERNVLWSTV